MFDVYLASSWRNPHFEYIYEILTAHGLNVYNFKNPSKKLRGFSWDKVQPNWRDQNTNGFIEMLKHPIAVEGFNSDFNAMRESKIFIMPIPCGRSAHLEAGWAIGQGKPTAILMNNNDAFEPELMYKLTDNLFIEILPCVEWAKSEIERLYEYNRLKEYNDDISFH